MGQPNKFPPHGKLKISVEDNILVVEHWGPFNIEYWVEHKKRVAPVVESLEEKGRFAAICVYHESLLFPPEAMDLFSSQLALAEFLGHECICALLVVGEQVEGRSFLLGRLITRANDLFGDASSPVVLNSIPDAIDFAKVSMARSIARE
jgi:hypothetical protein